MIYFNKFIHNFAVSKKTNPQQVDFCFDRLFNKMGVGLMFLIMRCIKLTKIGKVQQPKNAQRRQGKIRSKDNDFL